MKRLIAILLASLLLLSSCGPELPQSGGENNTVGDDVRGETAEVTDIGFEHVEENLETSMTVTCTEGTANAYTLENGILYFTGITQDSIYTVTGNLGGHIVIDVADDYKFELVLHGVIIQSSAEAPIIIKNGDKVTLTAKKDTVNFVYDLREAVDSSVEGVYSGAIHAECDLQIGGKGSLTVESKNNNGIHTCFDNTIPFCNK